MRAALLVLPAIAAASLAGAGMKVDHVTIAVKSLAGAQRMFAEAGIPTEFGGKHSNHLTEMALSSFPDGSYLELIAPQPGVDASAHYWGDFMAHQAGPCAWALTTPDIPAALRRLQAAGIDTHRTGGGRTRPDGVRIEWETATVGPAPQGSFFPFLISDETPRTLRAYPKGKPTTAKIAGVRYVVVGVRDLKDAIAKYRAAFGLGEPQQQDDATLGARLAWFPGTPAILAAPLSRDTWLAKRLKQFGEIPCAFVLGSSGSFHTAGESSWFSHHIAWLDPATLDGMRIAITRN
jgi:catechol 2,3-dioxygenase-like lactoylglutathione lyase family enzyme